jgi:hypothetical protein
MAADCIPQPSFKFDKLVVARFDAEHAICDGGAVLLTVRRRGRAIHGRAARAWQLAGGVISSHRALPCCSRG